MTGPLVVSYGMGVDSTAMLIGMAQRSIRPDLILFADTGGEKPETYQYHDVISSWLKHADFPPVTWVRYEPKRAPYHTLEQKCLTNEALPSLAYGWGTCATVFKIEPQLKFVRKWLADASQVVTFAVGFDAGVSDTRRRALAEKARQDNRYQQRFPLQEWGWTRSHCAQVIIDAGLPVPVKSACFFCPASKKFEILALKRDHPELYQRALDIEARAAGGRNGGGTTKGLGRRFAWADVKEADPEEKELLRP